MGGPGSGPQGGGSSGSPIKKPTPGQLAKAKFGSSKRAQQMESKSAQHPSTVHHGSTKAAGDHTQTSHKPMSQGKGMTNSGHFGDSHPSGSGGAFTRD